jgi:hypothetical protein
MLDFLPDDWRQRYADPSSSLRPPSEVVAAPHAVMCASRADYVGVIRRLVDIGMIAWTRSPRAVNGLFGVPKDPGDAKTSLRLIIDARPANALFVDPPHIELPTPDVIGRLSVPRGKKLYIAKADISDFYHRLLMPQSWWAYFALPHLTAAEATAAGIRITPFVGERGVTEVRERWWPCIKTLPMGFSHAVPLAQRLHEHFIDTRVGWNRDDRITSTSPLLVGSRARHCAYIDDTTIVGTSAPRMRRMLTEYIAAATAAGLEPKASKTVWPCTRAEVVGLEIDGIKQSLGVSPTKLRKLCDDTRALLARGVATADDMRRIVGRWTWAMLVRRPSLAVFSSVYRFMECVRRVPWVLWPTVARELRTAIGLAPLLFTSLTDTWCSHVAATDASMTGQGVVVTRTTHSAMASVAANRSLPGGSSASTPMMAAGADTAAASADSMTVLSTCDRDGDACDHKRTCSPTDSCKGINYELKVPEPQPTVCDPPPLAAVVCRPPPPAELKDARWTEIVSSRWEREEHINSLEVRAVITAIRWTLSRSATHATVNSRLLILSDSSATVGALSKGRSSSPVILRRCRTAAALLLASGLRLHLRWVPTEWNPADAASRR